MNISDEEYEELESYFQLKLKDKEEQLRHALQMRCEAEEKAFFAVSKVDEIRAVSYTHLTLPTKRIV